MKNLYYTDFRKLQFPEYNSVEVEPFITAATGAQHDARSSHFGTQFLRPSENADSPVPGGDISAKNGGLAAEAGDEDQRRRHRGLQDQALQERGGMLRTEEGEEGAGTLQVLSGGRGDEATELASQPRVSGGDVTLDLSKACRY